MQDISVDLSIIIVTYNVLDRLLKCLESIKLDNQKTFEIIIIDNNSTSENRKTYIKKISKQKYSRITRVILNRENIGFAKAVNQGIRMSTGRYLLLLNPDTELYENAINLLVNYLSRQKDPTVVGGQLIKPAINKPHGSFVRRIDFLSTIFDFTNLKKLFTNNIFSQRFYYKDSYKKIFSKNKEFAVQGLSGGFLMFSKNVVCICGMLDDNFFMYLEDVDFCYRANDNSVNVYFYPKAKAYHYSGSSSKNKYKVNVEAWLGSRRRLSYKYLNFYEYYLTLLVFIMDELLINLYHKIKGL